MYTVDTKTTATKIKTTAKTEIVNALFKFLVNTYGAENVAFVRDGSTPTNEIGVIIDEVTDGDKVYPLCMTVNPVIKSWKDQVGAKRTIPAFDFFSALDEYDRYVSEKNAKEAEKSKQKAEKIARDTAAREKKKLESEDKPIETTTTTK